MNFWQGLVIGVFGSVFLLFCVGVVAELISARKKKNTLKKEVDTTKSTYEKIKPRLEEAMAIAKLQLEIQAKLDSPSKNALDSKYKNALISESNTLEQEKQEILRSIIADGYDPIVQVDTAQGVVKATLSEYMRYLGMDPLPKQKTDPKPNETKRSIRKVGKFFVIDGGVGNGDKTH